MSIILKLILIFEMTANVTTFDRNGICQEKTEQKDLFDREREGKQKELCLRYVDRIEKVRAFT